MERWFMVVGGVRKGPFDLEQIVGQLLTLPDPGEAQVWRQGMVAWAPAGQVPEIKEQLPPPMPKGHSLFGFPSESSPSATGRGVVAPPPARGSLNPFVLYGRSFKFWGGGLSQSEYVIVVLSTVLVAVVLGLLAFSLGFLAGVRAATPNQTDFSSVVNVLWVICVVSPILGGSIKRLRDAGLSGWYMLVFLIPCGAFVLILYLMGKAGGRETDRPTPPGGANKALVALVVVVVALPLLGVVAAIAIPSLLRARVSANESAVRGDIRVIISASAAYKSISDGHGSGGYATTLTCLSAPSSAACIPNYPSEFPAHLIDSSLATAVGADSPRGGYVRRYYASANAAGSDKYCYSATPQVQNRTGVRSFGGDASGVIAGTISSAPVDCCGGGAELVVANCEVLEAPRPHAPAAGRVTPSVRPMLAATPAVKTPREAQPFERPREAAAAAVTPSIVTSPTKTYQVTGPLLEVTSKYVVLQKGGSEEWQLRLTPRTRVVGTLRMGAEAATAYEMTAVTVRLPPAAPLDGRLPIPGLKTYQLTGTLLAATVAKFVIQKGSEAWEIGRDVNTAVAREPTAGDRIAVQYWLTAITIHVKAPNVAEDIAETQSCESGRADACSSLGLRYYKGIGVPRDPARAVLLFQKGCDGGDAAGYYYLGLLYRDGEGVPLDDGLARRLFFQACRAGLAQACALLDKPRY